MPQSRRLAAIMFTDVVGYTAMMQRNEKEGLEKVHRFSEVMEAQAAANNGEILEFRGDGCLAVFNSAVEAMHAAKAIQESLKESPAVPLRIGIHIGDIVFTGGNIYGDGVNLASRVESMGVPGSILVTEQVIPNIKSHPEFKMASLGKFQFKNVETPMEVFALANEGFSVPKPEEMQGKGKKLKTSQTKSLFRFASIGFIAMILGAGIFWMFSNTPTETEKLEEIKASRIAILPFENKTNDPELDVLGDMAADHVIQGMMNLDDVKVVSYATIRDNLKEVDAQSEEFGVRTGAQKLIRGNIYKEGDSLFIQSQVIDLKSGDVDMVLPEIKSARDQSRKLVSELRSRILGFFVAQKARYSGNVVDQMAPKIEAFEVYDAFHEFWLVDYPKSRELLEKAISIDSTFFAPYQFYVWSWSNPGIWDKADSVVKLIDRRFPSLHGHEKLFQDFNKKLVSGKAHEGMPEIEGIFNKDPRHLFNNELMGLICMYRNFPQKGIEAMSHIEAANYPNEYFTHTWWHGIYAFHLIRKDRDAEASKVLSYVPIDTYHPVAINSRTLYHAKRGEADSISYFLDELEKYEYPPNLLGWRKHSAANYLAIYGDTLGQVELAEEIIAEFEKGELTDSVLLFDARVLAKQYDRALELGEYLVKNGRNPEWRIARMGWIHAQEGRIDQAWKLLDQIEEQYPKAHYQKAIIQTALGEYPEAMESLRKAFENGRNYSNTNYDFEYAFRPLWEYQPFVEKFMKPEG